VADRIRIAIAQTLVTVDPPANGTAIRAAMRQATDSGPRLVHLAEGNAGRPAPESFPCTLVPHDGPDVAGWDLRVSHGTATARPGDATPNR
jgi:predicted amidohydrolase